MRLSHGSASGLFALAMLVAGCGGHGVDWTGPENLMLRDQSARKDDGVELQYWSLVDAKPRAVYDALADVEHYPDFVPGVDTVQVLARTDTTKTVQIAQRVIGRQSNAKVEWKFFPDQLRIEFKTLQSNLSRNDGSFEIQASPDGNRTLVHSTYLVREGEAGNPVPIGVLATGTRESFLAAANGVKARATGASAVAGSRG
jgi:carbon monoxide dehydrogenase subunit G